MRLYIFLILFFSSIVVSAGGLSTWSQITPCGNEIWFESAYPNKWNYIVCEKVVNNSNFTDKRDDGEKISKWYFYNQKIIGISNYEKDNSFFVFDELNCKITYFQTQIEFDNYLTENELRPKVWTRWYDSYYGGWLYSNVNGTFIHLWNSIVAVLIMILSFWFLSHLIKSKFDLKSIRNKSFIVLVLIVSIILFLDIYPNSL